MPRQTAVDGAGEGGRTEGSTGESEPSTLLRRAARAVAGPIVPPVIVTAFFAFDLVTDLDAGVPVTHVLLEIVALCVAVVGVVMVARRR